MTDGNKPEPFEHERMTDAEAIEFVNRLDLPREAFALVNDSSLAKARDLILELASRHDLSVSAEWDRQTLALWERGFGQALAFSSLDHYRAVIPLSPRNPDPSRFDRLVLVDRRVPISIACQILGVDLHVNASELVDIELPSGKRGSPVGFIWCQDGRRRRGSDVPSVLQSLPSSDEAGLTAIEGLCLYAQDRFVLTHPGDLSMELPLTSSRSYMMQRTRLRRAGMNHVELDWTGGGVMDSYGGVATRAI
jgi:hypothetical protein